MSTTVLDEDLDASPTPYVESPSAKRVINPEIMQRIKATPKHIVKLSQTFAVMEHGAMTKLLTERSDSDVNHYAARLRCSDIDVHLVLDYICLTRMMSSDNVGMGPLQL
jgi:hypothetical protein